MQLFLGAVPIILRLFSKARGHLLFSNYSRNNLPKPTDHYIMSVCMLSVCMLSVYTLRVAACMLSVNVSENKQ